MRDIDLIYQLDILYYELDLKEKELQHINERLEIIRKNEEKQRYQSELENLYKITDEKHLEQRKKEAQLNDLKYKLANLKDSFEKATIKDNKQYEHFISSIEDLEEKIDTTELEIIEIMMNEDKINNLIDKTKYRIDEISKETTDLIKNYNLKTADLKKEIEELTNTILMQKKSISVENLAKYEKIKTKKKKAVATVKDKACSSCGMILPTSFYDLLQKNDDILLCENCGSILYYKKE